jgi:tetratricopeptide (TPR) repeat protein
MVREAFAADIHSAQADSLGRARVVGELIKYADDKSLSPGQRYATLEIAIEVAGQGDDPQLMRDALHSRAARFENQDAMQPMLDFLARPRGGDKVWVVEASLDLGEDALEARRVDVALKANRLAAEVIKKTAAKDADRLRPRRQSLEERSSDMENIFRQAAEAEQIVKAKPEDLQARTHLGFRAVVNRDWNEALKYFEKGRNELLADAAKKERSGPPDAAARDVWGLAEAWWKSASDEATPGPFQDRSTIDSSLVKQEVRKHAIELFRRAIVLDPDVANAIELKQLAARIAGLGPQAGAAVGPLPVPKLQVGVRPMVAPVIQFNAAAFWAAEGKRSGLFDDLRSAVNDGNQQAVLRLQQQLTALRGLWSQALHLYNRDAGLPERQAAIQKVLREQPDFADGHLCDCYLKILDGQKEAARKSLAKTLDLIQQNLPLQLWCGKQLLDSSAAALMVDDQVKAEKVKNFFRQKPFVGHPAVRFNEAIVFINKSMFSDALDELEKLRQKPSPDDVDPIQIAAEYAWLKAAVPVDRLRDNAAAGKAIEEVFATDRGPQWKAWRARAANLAEENKWDDAVKAVETATIQAPLIYADELDRQRKSYADKKKYWIERRKP